jgi:CheY-like chemotaxis protein
MPVVEVTATEPLEGFCEVGDMVCDIFKKLGATCKAGIKSAACPQKKAKKSKRRQATAVDVRVLIGVDQPFAYDEVVAATGADYVDHLVYDGAVQRPYDQLKAYIAGLDAKAKTDDRQATADIIQLRPRAQAQRPILVIDDETSVNNNIRRILKKSGHAVDQAFTKDQALERIRHGAYKLVLLDLKIPGVQGLELLETIRANQPQAQVIMITGYASIETAVAAARMGAVDYLPKPFTPDEIRSATENAFKLAA